MGHRHRAGAAAVIVSVSLPWPSAVLSPNARAHFMRKASAIKKARSEAALMTRAAKPAPVPAEGPLRVCILATPSAHRTRDADNMVARLKAALDGIAQGLGVDDSRFVVWPVQWAEPKRPGGVVVTVEAMP